MKQSAKPGSAPNLDRDWVVTAAFAQLDEDGLEGLSMRKLAARLGVQAPALYWHFGDKAELLGLMARDIYGVAYAGVPPCDKASDWLRAFGRVLRAAFDSHRDGARLCAVAKPPSAPDPAAHAANIARGLVALGLDQSRALSTQASVISFVLGWASFAANGPMHDFLDDMLDFEASFEAGLVALVDGFRLD